MQTEATSAFPARYARSAQLALAVLIAIKLAVVFLFAWHIQYVMDEMGQIGFAKYLGGGIFETVQPTKALGFAAFYKLAHLIGEDAVSILRVGRLQVALLGCATLCMIYACARALHEDRLRALAIVLVLLSFSNFAERIYRTISEPIALFFAVAALLVVLRGASLSGRRLLVAGILSGLAFLTTQKSVYFNIALALGLMADAALARRYLEGVSRAAWLVLGWIVPVVGYCFAFPSVAALRVAQSIVSGPLEAATRGDGEYDGLGEFIVQTLVLNPILYAFCFGGMLLALLRIRALDQSRRIALVFTIVVTTFVFLHNQPWPYVFLMAQPFVALWVLGPIDRVSHSPRQVWLALAVLALASSFARNIECLRFGNAAQLAVVERAEAMTAPGEVYFDGIGMVPNRPEPSDLWLDVHFVLATLAERENSEAYRILTEDPPKIVIWSYRMEAIKSVVGPLIEDSYVRVAPNLRLAGQRLSRGKATMFDVPVGGVYRLYDAAGNAVQGRLELDGAPGASQVILAPGQATVLLQSGPAEALLVPEGRYTGVFSPGDDNPS
ncbi:MAG TPA: hypothetical protein VI168_09080, partial [Croceibacterium sp.]